jgi:hypothetical protein
MAKIDNNTLIHDEVIMKKIYLLRGSKVMMDRDLAELYEIETKQLKRAVRRNISRFPEDFMFELSPEESNDLRSQLLMQVDLHDEAIDLGHLKDGIYLLKLITPRGEAYV